MNTTNPNQITERTAQLAFEAIRESGKTVSEVARTTGIPYATLYRKLHGHSDINIKELSAVAMATGKPFIELLPADLTRNAA